MYPELSNLLPKAYKRALRMGYFMRLATIGCILATILVIIHGILLLPSLVFSHANTQAKEAELAALKQSLVTTETLDADARITSLRDDSTYLLRLGTVASASASLRQLLAVPRPGIRLTGFTLAEATSEGGAKVTVAGMALNRDSVRAYVAALGRVPFVQTADLPISTYAKERDIPFIISLTLKPNL